MALTLTDLQEKLKKIDEVSLMEVLEITSEDIVQRFVDKIEDKFDELEEEFEEDEEEHKPHFTFDEEDEDVYENNLDLYDDE